MDRSMFEAARDKLAVSGLHLTSDSGEIDSQGVRLSYAYDGNMLIINVEHKPFIYPEQAVEAKIRSWFTTL